MATISIGDSIAVGISTYTDRSYAHVGDGLYSGVDSAFERAIPTIQPGDTVLISVGTNDWGLGSYSTYAQDLRSYIDRITTAGGQVVLLGVKEEGYEGGGYTGTIGSGNRAEHINALLRESVAGNPNARFSEESITAANAIPGDVHGNYQARFNAALGSTATAQTAATTRPTTTTAQEAGVAPDNGTTPEDMNPLMLFAMLFQALGQLINGETIQFAGSTTPSESLPSPTTPNTSETQRAIST